MAYDNERYGTKHTTCLGLVSNDVATTNAVARFRAFTAAKILEVYSLVHGGAGTATDSGYIIKKATTSIGAIACSSSAAGVVVNASLTDTDFETTDVLNIHTTLSDTNLKGFLYVVWQERFVA